MFADPLQRGIKGQTSGHFSTDIFRGGSTNTSQ